MGLSTAAGLIAKGDIFIKILKRGDAGKAFLCDFLVGKLGAGVQGIFWKVPWTKLNV